MNLVQKIIKKVFMSCALLCAASITFSSYGQIGQFSAAKNIGTAGSEQTQDLTVSLYRPWNQMTPALRSQYESVIGYWADGIYEMTNGGHRLGKIRIFSEGRFNNTANIIWIDAVNPKAHLNGFLTDPLKRIQMADIFGYTNPGTDLDHQGAGYCLAHESGHFIYSMFDEYVGNEFSGFPHWPQPIDISVIPSIMNSQWNARNGNLEWLNFSTPCNWSLPTAHGRLWNSDAWTAVARNPSLDVDQTGGWLNALLDVQRVQYPALTGRFPNTSDVFTDSRGIVHNCMRADLPSAHARDNL
jgi:hypothetical protein